MNIIDKIREEFLNGCSKIGVDVDEYPNVSFEGYPIKSNHQHSVVDYVNEKYCIYYYERGRKFLDQEYDTKTALLKRLFEDVAYFSAYHECNKKNVDCNDVSDSSPVMVKYRELVSKINPG
jgi:hypothetical protein